MQALITKNEIKEPSQIVAQNSKLMQLCSVLIPVPLQYLCICEMQTQPLYDVKQIRSLIYCRHRTKFSYRTVQQDPADHFNSVIMWEDKSWKLGKLMEFVFLQVQAKHFERAYSFGLQDMMFVTQTWEFLYKRWFLLHITLAKASS